MPDETRTKRLLWDALSRVMDNPTASAAWLALLAAYEAVADPAVLAVAVRIVEAEAPRDGIAGFFRSTFLAGLGHDIAHIAEAGRLARAIRPVDPDRLMAFANFEWGRAVASAADRTSFVSQLRLAQLPEIVVLAGEELVRRSPPLRPRGSEAVRRVAVVTPFLGQEGHPPTVLALRHAGLLLDAGLEVQAFACQEPMLDWSGDFLGNNGRVSVAAPPIEELAALAPAGLILHLADPDFSMLHRWREIAAAIDRFDPDLVLFVGLYSPLVTALHRARPVLGLGVHSTAPVAPVDAWLASDPNLSGRETSPWGEALPPAFGVHHPYRVRLKPTGAPLGRAQILADEDDLVIVTVGARLHEEIAGEWAERMTALILSRPKAVWLLVGGTGIRPPALTNLPDERLRLAPYQADLRAVLACCDVYANPPRMGGGFSVAEAMAEGLAVVALADADGGDKLGEDAVLDLDGYFERLEGLVDDAEQRQVLGARLKARFARTLDLDRSAPWLLAACDVALARGRARLGV